MSSTCSCDGSVEATVVAVVVDPAKLVVSTGGSVGVHALALAHLLLVGGVAAVAVLQWHYCHQATCCVAT